LDADKEFDPGLGLLGDEISDADSSLVGKESDDSGLGSRESDHPDPRRRDSASGNGTGVGDPAPKFKISSRSAAASPGGTHCSGRGRGELRRSVDVGILVRAAMW